MLKWMYGLTFAFLQDHCKRVHVLYILNASYMPNILNSIHTLPNEKYQRPHLIPVAKPIIDICCTFLNDSYLHEDDDYPNWLRKPKRFRDNDSEGVFLLNIDHDICLFLFMVNDLFWPSYVVCCWRGVPASEAPQCSLPSTTASSGCPVQVICHKLSLTCHVNYALWHVSCIFGGT